ncbi:MAG: class II aldolase/adducin family protein [Clostridiales bacterium]|jgi:L-ribulose-5-phosphate 4-epimerase|nr:class II aldolase/adducin family protein [Clostridiales bacterium]
MREKELRTALTEAGKRLVRENLVQGTWGNLSARLDEKRMIVTPSGIDYLLLTPDDMVVVDIESLEHAGPHKPTSEKKLHAAIYADRREINAVIHTHSEYCSVAAAARADFPSLDNAARTAVGQNIRCAAYGLPGTKKMTQATVAALKDRNGCFLANHGAIAMGTSLENALNACRILENAAREHIEKTVLKKTGLKTFSDEALLEAFFGKVETPICYD